MKTLKNCLYFGLLSLVITAFLPLSSAQAQAMRGLPDFTELVEKAGPAVVNIRTTERVRQGNAQMPFPGMPELDENDPLYEFFRRFL
ncbi:MAG: hypothetical protein ACK5VG_04260, partial [Burkholderiales bacterium]